MDDILFKSPPKIIQFPLFLKNKINTNGLIFIPVSHCIYLLPENT
jgi:hypothetical protein